MDLHKSSRRNRKMRPIEREDSSSSENSTIILLPDLSIVRVQEESTAETRSSEMLPSAKQSIDELAVYSSSKAGCDSFCFKCHTNSAVLSLVCSLCKCSYHRHCVRQDPIPKISEEFVCSDCRDIQNAENSNVNKFGHQKIDSKRLADLLMIALEKIRTYPDREHYEHAIVAAMDKEPQQPLIVRQMSLEILEDRIKSSHYKVSDAFIQDIKQLEHNWNIVDGSKAMTLKKMIEVVFLEINALESCSFCYERSSYVADWFVHPCDRPHLIVWAKLKGYPYWPAKVMSVDVRQQIEVRFFGAHDRARVPAKQCFLFSKQDPNKTKGVKQATSSQAGIAEAIQEADMYVEKLRDKYGFNYSPALQAVIPNNLMGHLKFMLPKLEICKKDLGVLPIDKKKSNSIQDQEKAKKRKLNGPNFRTTQKNQKVAKNTEDESLDELQNCCSDQIPLKKLRSRDKEPIKETITDSKISSQTKSVKEIPMNSKKAESTQIHCMKVFERSEVTGDDLASLIPDSKGSRERSNVMDPSISSKRSSKAPQRTQGTAKKSFPNPSSELQMPSLMRNSQPTHNKPTMIWIPTTKVPQNEADSSNRPSQALDSQNLISQESVLNAAQGSAHLHMKSVPLRLNSVNPNSLISNVDLQRNDLRRLAPSPTNVDDGNMLLRANIEKLQSEIENCKRKIAQMQRDHFVEMYQLKVKNDIEKGRAIMEARRQCEIEKQQAIELTIRETKKTTWCSNCPKEARLNCCWKTSYCCAPCQKTHWQHHQQYCTNLNS